MDNNGKLQIRMTNVFKRNQDALNNSNIRFVINQGGTRSTKSYSIIQLFIYHALTNPNKIISIVRVSLPALKGSAIRDFIEIMYAMGIYNPSQHFLGENAYKFDNGSIIEFFSIDDPMRLRGRKRHILLIDEANELSKEQFNQLNLRTTEKIFLAYNPHENYSWVYDLKLRDNSIFIKSTYKDNPFLSEELVKEIENYKNEDEEYYKIFALGEQAVLKSTIYTRYDLGDYVISGDTYYGLDTGYNDPMVLTEINEHDGTIYVKEVIYESKMTTADLIERMILLNIDKNKIIAVDSASPAIIEELQRNGYNAVKAIKDIKDGIDAVKRYKLIIDKISTNLIKEIRSYKWKTRGDFILDEPVGVHDHAMDSMRYAIYYYHLQKTKPFEPAECY